MFGLPVLNNFMNNRFELKSRDCKSALSVDSIQKFSPRNLFLVLSMSRVDILIDCLFPAQLSTPENTILLRTCYWAME